MSEKHDIDTYAKLAEAAEYYLDESFRHIHNAMSSELASILFEKKIETVNVSKKDRALISKLHLTDDHIHLLQNDVGEVLTNSTLQKLADAWYSSLSESKHLSHKFAKDHQINSIELLGHINFLAFFVETLTNRHLLFLKQKKTIDNFTYNNLSLAKILNRLIFVCKDELEKNTLQLNEIANLFTLRNKTVHYTPDNALSLKADIASLIRIWNQTIKLLKTFEKKEKFIDEIFSKEMNIEIEAFKKRWT